MAKDVPVGYVDFILNITRAGDPEPFAVTFGAKTGAGPFDQISLAGVAAAATDQLAELLLSGDTLSEITAYVANDGPPFIYTQAIGTAGDWNGQPLPSNCAVVITKDTGLGGRWNRGRVFWPSIAEGQVDGNGLITPAIAQAYSDRWNAFMGQVMNADPGPQLDSLVVFHDETLGLLPTPIINFRAEAKIGTQRRRMRR